MLTTIDTVAQEIRACGRSISGRRRKVPTAVQQRAVKLLERHSWSDVCEALDISQGLLGSWRLRHHKALGLKARSRTKRTEGKGKSSPHAPAFLELTPTPSSKPESDYIELRTPDGTLLRAHGTATVVFTDIAKAFLNQGQPA